MGYELSSWAQTLEHPCLTPRTRQVLSAICLVAHDDHGEFWMRGKRLIEEYLPDMSYGGYRNCLGRLVRNGLLIKVEHGGGRTSSGRGTTTRYRVNSPVVRNPHPAQGVLPEITRSSQAYARSPEPEVSDERGSVSAGDVYRRVDELLAVGITPEWMMALLEAVSETMTGSGNMSRPAEETCHDPEKHVTDHDRFPENTSRIVTGFGRETRYDSEKHVTDHDRFPTNMSQIMTSPQIHEEKIIEEKEEAAAAANLSRTKHDPPDFFELLAGSLAEAGHGGIRAAQFSDMRGLVATYEKLTGSPPDERTVAYIAGRVSESRGVRNVVGLRAADCGGCAANGRGLCGRSRPRAAACVSAGTVERAGLRAGAARLGAAAPGARRAGVPGRGGVGKCPRSAAVTGAQAGLRDLAGGIARVGLCRWALRGEHTEPVHGRDAGGETAPSHRTCGEGYGRR